MPGRAWQLIREVVATEYVTNRMCFYWLLALTSGRTRHELPKEDAALLRDRRRVLRVVGDGAWADGVRMINRLLDCAEQPDADLRLLFKEFQVLGYTQRSRILRHLELFLDGPLKDQMWQLALTRAESERLAGDRVDRVWKFFQPQPAGPRSREPLPVTIPMTTWFQAVPATAVLVVAAGHIGSLLAWYGRPTAFLAYLVSIAGGYFGVRSGLEWHFRTMRRRAKDGDFAAVPHRTSAPPGGFARKVDQRFDYYFAKYVPEGMSRDAWLTLTAGIRRHMRDETVEVYRERRTSAEQISWLIRYRAADVKRRWCNGTLWEYRRELATPVRTKAAAVGGIALLAGGGTLAAGGAVLVSPLSGVGSIFVALAGGWIAARAWLHIALERRRYAADRSEAEQDKAEITAAFADWQATLADRPDDREMAAWLDCDRKVLLNEALRHYRLSMSDVISHAFIEAPAPSTARARVRGGPWRYTRYQLLLFVLTADGVRQITVSLDFRQGTFHDRKRANYRFEKIAAVRVNQADNHEQTFELALVNGTEIRVQVMAPEMEELQQGENSGEVSEVTLDAAGLHHTLHVLEGIAAEGSAWLAQEHRRGQDRMNGQSRMTNRRDRMP
ncbi:hypothetical protein [Acrocarpospora catenulata]|uniref:hypothetical protein n=1 Tax=Acrocarpospora catenulata TaxID=2836182 RepID=UPI001BDA2DC8|nr:hypothetical protein [Acrocarpospora catenulata]